jgi:hypothetical protein
VSRAPLFAWLCLGVWGTWIFALQGLLASSALRRWTPDLGLLLLVALTLRLGPARARWAAAWVALLRVGFSADPPLAILAAYLGFVGVCHLVREAIDLERPLARALLACAGALGCAWLWTSARALELAADGIHAPLERFAWPSALATGLAALVLAPALGRLPGLSPLARRRGR